MKELRGNRGAGSFHKWAARGMAVCAVGLMCFVWSITGLAARTGNVQIDGVNVRSEASTESQRVCQLPINTTVDIVDEKTDGDNKTWYNVSFTYEGEQKAGWIRSDMLTVSETEDPGEGDEGGEAAVHTGGLHITEPEESREPADYLTQTTISVGEESFTAWQVDPERTNGREMYLVAAAKDGEASSWYYYDPLDQTFQRETGQFAGAGADEPEGLIESLQGELEKLKEDSRKQLSMRLYVIIGLGALCAILLILVIVFAVKLRNTEYEYEDEEEPEEEEIIEKPKRRRGRRAGQEEEEEDDFDDFLRAAKKKQADDGRKADREETEEEKPDLSLTANLPEIDMSAVLAAEEEAQEAEAKKSAAAEPKKARKEEPEEDFDDFDIEILDFDDLDL